MATVIYAFLFIFVINFCLFAEPLIDYKFIANGEIGNTTISLSGPIKVSPPFVNYFSIKKPEVMYAVYSSVGMQPNFFKSGGQTVYYGSKYGRAGFIIDDCTFLLDQQSPYLFTEEDFLNENKYWLQSLLLENFARKVIPPFDAPDYYSFSQLLDKRLEPFEKYRDCQLFVHKMEETDDFYKVEHEYVNGSSSDKSVTIYDKDDYNMLQSNGTIKTRIFNKDVRFVYILERTSFKEREIYTNDTVHGIQYPYGYLLKNNLRIADSGFSPEEAYKRIHELYTQNYKEIETQDVLDYMANYWIKDDIEMMLESAKTEKSIYHSALQLAESAIEEEAIDKKISESVAYYAEKLPKHQIRARYNRVKDINSMLDLYSFEPYTELVFDIVVWKFAKTILSSDEYTQSHWRHILREKLEMLLKKEYAEIKNKEMEKKKQEFLKNRQN
jgi:hypothetical protein